MSWRVGDCFTSRRVLLQQDFDRFARLTGDDNPIHCDPDFARASHFGATVSHGMLLYGCIAKGLSELVPGPGAVQFEQELMFPNPTFAGDEITISLSVEAVHADGSLVLHTNVTRPGSDAAIVTAQGRCHVGSCGIERGAPAALPQAAPGDAQLFGLRPGMSAHAQRCFSNEDLDEYGDLIGDRNPLFRDDAYARQSGFARRIVPGPLLAGMFSELLGTRLPGRGTGWMKQKLLFLTPAYPGEMLEARVEITRLRESKALVTLRSTIATDRGRLVCDGESLVLVRDLDSR